MLLLLRKIYKKNGPTILVLKPLLHVNFFFGISMVENVCDEPRSAICNASSQRFRVRYQVQILTFVSTFSVSKKGNSQLLAKVSAHSSG